MLHCFAKTKTRIEDNALPGNPVLHGTVQALGKETVDIIQHVSIRRRSLHRLWRPLHVHEHH